jgi:plasmid maintenance system antidote protein VapI
MENHLSEVLEQKRGKRMTQYRLMKDMGVAQGTARNALENKEWFPTRDTALKIYEAYGLQLSEWLYCPAAQKE